MFSSIGRSVRSLLGVCAIMLSSSAIAAGGPDVTVFALSDTQNFGATNGIRGYSIGTTSCNIGTAPLAWCDESGGCTNGVVNLTSAQHPVIAQNLYRLKDGRFEQIGASWLKHGFLSLNQTAASCGNGTCQQPPLGGSQLGVGCTDPYGAGLNGSRPLGRRSEVNGATGVFPFPIGGGGATAAVWNQRVAVAESDLAAASNPGARYFAEGHYIAGDDGVAGNGLNNASYREVSVNASFNLSFVGGTVRERAAINAWPTLDPSVQLINVDVPSSSPLERFHLARKVTQVAPGLWRYEFAIHNMNSDRSADRFSVDFGQPTTFTGIGFKDVNAHSNEPYDTTDWASSTSATAIQWEAAAFTPAQDANALRWGTMYNFWFEATSPPLATTGVLRLFKPGSPTEVTIALPAETMFSNGFE